MAIIVTKRFESDSTKRTSPMLMKKTHALAYKHDIGRACKGDILSRHASYKRAREALNRNAHARYLEIIELI